MQGLKSHIGCEYNSYQYAGSLNGVLLIDRVASWQKAFFMHTQ